MCDIQRKDWFVVINAPYEKNIKEVYDKLEWYLIREVDNFYRIIHDKDIKENGELKREHIHLIVELKSRVRFSTLLSRLSNYLDIEENLISLEDIRNIGKAAQYLIHKNDKTKYQYSVEDIDTNNIERLNYLLKSEERVSLSTEELFDIVDNAQNVRELVRNIGIDMYIKYGRVIDLLWKDKIECCSKNYIYKE